MLTKEVLVSGVVNSDGKCILIFLLTVFYSWVRRDRMKLYHLHKLIFFFKNSFTYLSSEVLHTAQLVYGFSSLWSVLISFVLITISSH